MNVTHSSLSRIDQHWAVLAVGTTERDRGLKMVNARLVQQALDQQIQFQFDIQWSEPPKLDKQLSNKTT